MATEVIRSRQNARVKQLRKAFDSPGRNAGEIIAIEGSTMLAEVLRSGLAVEALFLREHSEFHLEPFLDQLGRDVSLHVLSAEVFDSAVATESPQGIAALLKIPALGSGIAPLAAPNALVVVLDAVQDPGNVGTILRSAEAFGATCVVRLASTASPWNLKALRASAGSVWRLPTFAMDEAEAYAAMKSLRFQFIAAVAQKGQAPDALGWSGPIALLIGSEGRGLSPEWLARATHHVTIPMPGQVESLNAAMAASLLLYEASKQRSNARPQP
jgi:TrmH family RNA methyltransferase